MSVLVNKQAPDFNEKAVIKGEYVDGFTLSQFKGKYVILFFYPFDFTFVCPTEMHAFQAKLADFKSKNCEIIAVSTDSHHSHAAWLRTPKKEGGIEGIEYPIISDFNKKIATDYDVLLEGGQTLRGLFLIDQKGVVQHQVVNNDGLGRNIDEAMRMLDALQFTEKNGVVCPANWNEGDKTLTADRDGLDSYFG